MTDKYFDPPSADYTFCIDPECNNECGRKMSERIRGWMEAGQRISCFLTCPAKEEK